MTRSGLRGILPVLVASLTAVAVQPGALAYAQAGAIRGFVGVSPDAVTFIRWTELGGTLRGQYQAVYVPANKALTVENLNMPFTGVRNGPNISLTFSEFFSSQGT